MAISIIWNNTNSQEKSQNEILKWKDASSVITGITDIKWPNTGPHFTITLEPNEMLKPSATDMCYYFGLWNKKHSNKATKSNDDTKHIIWTGCIVDSLNHSLSLCLQISFLALHNYRHNLLFIINYFVSVWMYGVTLCLQQKATRSFRFVDILWRGCIWRGWGKKNVCYVTKIYLFKTLIAIDRTAIFLKLCNL